MFLAEATNSDVVTWGMILVLTTIAANVAAIFFSRRKQKREVSFEMEPVSKADFQAHQKHCQEEHDKIFSKIGGVERGAARTVEEKVEALRVERREDTRTLHHEINEVGKKVASLEKETELQNQRMASMDAKLDRLIERR